MIRQIAGVSTRPATYLVDWRRIVAWATTASGIWTIWIITRAIMMMNLIVGQHYADPQFYQYAGDLAQGKLPYISIPVEYPPLALLLILIPALPLLPFAAIAPRPGPDLHTFIVPHLDPSRYGAYGMSFGVFMMAIDALTLVLVMRVAQRYTFNDAAGRWSGLIYTLLGMASGAVLQKFDLAVGTLCLLAVVMLLEKRDGWAWAFLAMATLTKGYPILLAPLFICWSFYNKQLDWTALRRAIVGGGVTCFTVVGPVLLAAGIQPLLDSVLYHADRGIEIESTWGSIMMATTNVHGLAATTGMSLADLSLDIHSALENPLAQSAMPALIVFTVVAYLLFWYRLHLTNLRFTAQIDDSQPSQQIMFTYLIQITIAVSLIFMLTFRAFPAHYLLAILPLVAVLRLPDRYTMWWLTLLVVSMILGQLAVSFWSQIALLEPGPTLLLIGRNVLLVLSCIVLLRAPVLSLWQAKTAERCLIAAN